MIRTKFCQRMQPKCMNRNFFIWGHQSFRKNCPQGISRRGMRRLTLTLNRQNVTHWIPVTNWLSMQPGLRSTYLRFETWAFVIGHVIFLVHHVGFPKGNVPDKRRNIETRLHTETTWSTRNGVTRHPSCTSWTHARTLRVFIHSHYAAQFGCSTGGVRSHIMESQVGNIDAVRNFSSLKADEPSINTTDVFADQTGWKAACFECEFCPKQSQETVGLSFSNHS